jgi:hypothetical protein
MGKLSPIICVLRRVVNRVRNEFSVSNQVTTQFVCNDLPWTSLMPQDQTFEEALGCLGVSLGLQKHVDDFTVLINRTPQIVLFTLYFDEDFIQMECITVSLMVPSQSTGELWSELVAPEPNGFITHQNAFLS